MEIILTIILSIFFAISVSAQQSPESIVRDYIRLLNDWLASPYDMQKKEKVYAILQNGKEKCTMKDEIVEKYNSDAGASRCIYDTYLSILRINKVDKIEIINLKDNSDNDGVIVTAVLAFYGGINLTTASDFWISDNQITYIVSNDREILKIAQKNYINSFTTHTNEDTTFTIGKVSFKMVYIQGGTFQMGTNNCSDEDKPIHTVKISNYYIGETEVTQELWKTVMGNNPSRFKKGNQYPVENISWFDCQEFIKQLNQRTGLHFRLPTEAEWEYAACGGNKAENKNISIVDFAWGSNNSHNKTHPVKLKRPNELNLYDMLGNVWEWCQDWYSEYTHIPQSNQIELSDNNRVLRGCCYLNIADNCCKFTRHKFSPNEKHKSWGFRLALNTLH